MIKAPRGKYKWAIRHHDVVLPNGLRVLVVPRPNAHRAVATMLFRVGSRFETAKNNGVSHFLEHMLYRGSPSHKTAHDQALAFEQIGASLYAATQTDFGTMNLSLPPESFRTAIPLFAEVVEKPRFSAIEIERGIVREEILEDLDDEGRQIDADNIVRSVLYGEHPLGFTITGSLGQLDTFDRAMLKRHHARHYTTANSVLCFAGAVDPDECIRLASQHFAEMPRGEQVPVSPPPPLPKKPRLKHVSNISSQTTLRIAFRAFSDRHPMEPALEMLLRVLDDGMSTRLYERVCDTKGLCYDVGALYESYEDDGVFDVAAEAQHDRVLDVAAEIFAVLRELAEAGPSQAEVDRAKQRHHWQTQAMLDDSDALAGYYALAALSKLVPTPGDRYEQLAAVTQADVRSAAERVFRRQQMGLVTVGGLTQAQQGTLREMVAQFP